MRTEKQAVAVRDLVEEAKKRIVLLIICVVGLSYLMSLTSSSVWVNLPGAALLIIILRYLSVDFEMRRKAEAYNSKPSPENIFLRRKSLEAPKAFIEISNWRRKVNSPVVEDAIDHFTRHLVSEWVTDLWYARITPDQQAPEELVQIINGVLGEISCRVRNINLIDLLTRDIINLICTHLELFRATQTKVQRKELGPLTIEQRDMELKSILAAENKLHPVLFSANAEYKVLQHIMDGLISFTFKPEDLHCSLFRFMVRELLACTVIRPVLNLASPRFINERIESLVISLRKRDKGSASAQMQSDSKSIGPSKISTAQFSRSLDPSVKGVELVQLKKDQSNSSTVNHAKDNANGKLLSKDPLLAVDTRSTRSWSSLPSDPPTDDGIGIQRHQSGEEWGDMLDVISRRKTEALAPEHFENMWAKGRNYKKKEGSNRLPEPVQQSSSAGFSKTVDHSKASYTHREKDGTTKGDPLENNAFLPGRNGNLPSISSYEESDEYIESGTSSSYPTEDEDTNNVTGLDSPGVKVWDNKNNRNLSVSQIHHPLESFEGHKARKPGKGRRVQSQRLPRTHSSRKRSRLNNQKVHMWQEVERTSFLSGDGQDILHSNKGRVKSEDSSGDSEGELLGRIYSGATASSSVSPISIPETHILSDNAPKTALLVDSFLKLRCEVLGANIVKSGSSTFAVYSISVTDVDNRSWTIKRRFRHFEELHRRLKEFPEYNLHLPPKHFLSTGLDTPVIQERCQLLDKYLKKLLQLSTISGSIEVWDFLSVDSQTYSFSDSISIIETLSVNLDYTACEKNKEVGKTVRPVLDPVSYRRDLLNAESKESAPQVKRNSVTDGSRLNSKSLALSPSKKPAKEFGKPFEDSGSDSDKMVRKNDSSTQKLGKTIKGGEVDGLHASSGSHIDAASDPTLPSEWVPPNLSVPILDLVDVIFQLQDGGWIRRKAFWVAKQVLQLGMGDAFDDWLIEKIQVLRRGSVVASGISRVEQILWPDGIFLTKHPRRQRPTPSPSLHNSPHGQPPTPLSPPTEVDINKFDEMQEKEAQRRAKFVYELMIDNAPSAIVGIFGRKEYEQCAKDLYYFLQSAACLKQLAFELLELLLLTAFPELDYVFRQLHEEKEKFGEFVQK